MMNWFAFFPGLYKDPNVGGDKIGFFVNPSDKGKGSQLGGQGISVVVVLAEPGRGAAVHQVVRAARRAEEVVGARRLLVPQGGAAGPGLPEERAVRGRLPDGDGQVVKDFWAEPSYAQLLLADAEARPRLRRRRQGHRQGSARRPGRRTGRRCSRKTARSEHVDRCAARRPRLRRPRRRGSASTAANRAMTDAEPTSPRRRARAGARPAAAGRAACAACRTGRSPGCSSRRRCCCCWRSTSSR